MEALILIFGELAFALLAPFILLVIDLIGSAIGLTLSLSIGSSAKSPNTGRAAQMFGLVLGLVATVILAVLWVVNSFYFDNAVRYVLGIVEKRSDITATCGEIDGSLFAGRVNLRNCTVRRLSHPTSSFDLSVDEVTLDLRVTSLLGTAKIDVARVAGFEGWLASDRSATRAGKSDTDIEKPRRAFEIGELDVSDVRITLSGINPDGNPFELPVEIRRIESEPLRSRLALFDVMFRSNVTGSIAGAAFEISTSSIEEGRQTTWRVEQVPVASLGALTGGPLSWFSSGSVDMHVDDQWQRGDALRVDMDWRLEFSDVEVTAPPGTGALGRLASGPLTRYVNGFGGQFPLEFQMVVNESQFEFQSSLAAAGLWSAVGESINGVLGTFGIDLKNPSETGNALKEGAKSVLERLRKPEGDE